MKELHFTIPGRLAGKGRPRFSRSNGRPMVYTPTKTRLQENALREQARLAMRRENLSMLEGPIALSIAIVQTAPASWSKVEQARKKWIVTRPDSDNQIKSLGDAFNGVIWNDDAQVAQISFSRAYGNTNSTQISVCELE